MRTWACRGANVVCSCAHQECCCCVARAACASRRQEDCTPTSFHYFRLLHMLKNSENCMLTAALLRSCLSVHWLDAAATWIEHPPTIAAYMSTAAPCRPHGASDAPGGGTGHVQPLHQQAAAAAWQQLGAAGAAVLPLAATRREAVQKPQPG